MPTANVARQGAIEALEPQTFAAESDRARLSNVAVKAFIALSKAWDLSNAEASALLGYFGQHARSHEARLSSDLEPGPADARLGFGRNL